MATPEVPSMPRRRGTATTIRLKSGGTVTLSLTLDLFALRGEDRAFVLELVARMADYDEANVTDQPKSAPAASKAASAGKASAGKSQPSDGGPDLAS